MKTLRTIFTVLLVVPLCLVVIVLVILVEAFTAGQKSASIEENEFAQEEIEI